MKTIPVRAGGGRDYPIRVGAPLSGLGRALKPLALSPSLMVVSTAPVASRHAAPLLAGLRSSGLAPRLVLMPDGEAHKTLRSAERLYREALRARLDRRGAIIALGGGVVGDVAGFVAATYMRGVALVQCPTTLLAMVDSSIGGKTAVDLPEGKNLVGAFWPPRLVWMDLSTLKTLPAREWRTGLAEVIKYGIISDKSIVARLERTSLPALKRGGALLGSLVARSAAIKADVVSRDERETKGLREILNLGHTFGHAVESVTGYADYTHGEAIAVGMCAAARLARDLGLFRPADVARLEALFERWGLPARARRPLPRAKVLAAMARDKKALAGRFRFVVPAGWGRAKVISGVPSALLNRILSEVGLCPA